MPYTLSYYQPVIRTTLHRPKWWRFWEKPRLIHERDHERVVVHNVSQSTADFLIKHGPGILLEIIPKAQMIQLEKGEQPTSYIKTVVTRDYDVGEDYLKAMTLPDYEINGVGPELVMDYEKGFYACTKGNLIKGD